MSKQHAPRGIDLSACELHGRHIDLGRVTMPLPEPGTGVGTSVLTEDGETSALVTVAEGDVEALLIHY